MKASVKRRTTRGNVQQKRRRKARERRRRVLEKQGAIPYHSLRDLLVAEYRS